MTTLDHLPKFAVSAVEDSCATGSFADPRWVGERYITCVVGAGERFIWGRLVRVDTDAGICTFVPDDVDELQFLRSGQSYPRLDGYWGERVELVLDQSKNWHEREFEPVDAVQFMIDNGRMVTRLSSAAPTGGEVIKGGWDHEHCEICMATISLTQNPRSMFCEPDHWVCSDCYQQFIVPRSLGFIGEN